MNKPPSSSLNLRILKTMILNSVSKTKDTVFRRRGAKQTWGGWDLHHQVVLWPNPSVHPSAPGHDVGDGADMRSCWCCLCWWCCWQWQWWIWWYRCWKWGLRMSMLQVNPNDHDASGRDGAAALLPDDQVWPCMTIYDQIWPRVITGSIHLVNLPWCFRQRWCGRPASRWPGSRRGLPPRRRARYPDPGRKGLQSLPS